MDKETKVKLRDSGREDLIKTFYVLRSGYAGINKDGTILDRREHDNLVPIPKNSNIDRPEPKEVNGDTPKCTTCNEITYEGYECFCERKKTYYMGVDLADPDSNDISIFQVMRKTPNGEVFYVRLDKQRPEKTHKENLKSFRDKVKELAGYYSIPMDEDKIKEL